MGLLKENILTTNIPFKGGDISYLLLIIMDQFSVLYHNTYIIVLKALFFNMNEWNELSFGYR